MIKLLSIFIISIGLLPLNDKSEVVKWVSLEQALESNKSNPKPIFIDFTAEWCGWCKVMDKNTFSDVNVSAYMNENFYSVRLDYDSKEQVEFFGEKYTPRELGEKYKVPGLPTILLVAPDNKKSKTLVGYKKPDPFLAKLKSVNF